MQHNMIVAQNFMKEKLFFNLIENALCLQGKRLFPIYGSLTEITVYGKR
jgi:hypothetical protein